MTSNKTLGASLIIAGTSIGVGMLALPVATSALGYFPTLSLLFISWIIMTLTAFMMLEVNLWLPSNTNLISMARATLGKGGQIFAWISYLLLIYALLTAYTTGLGNIIQLALSQNFGIHLANWMSASIFVLFISYFLYAGMRHVDQINRFLMIGLVIIYFVLLKLITPHLSMDLVMAQSSSSLHLIFPIVAVSFGYQIVIPGLRVYLDENIPDLKRSILIGSFLAFLVYAIWALIIMGTIPHEGETGLKAIEAAQGDSASNLAIALSKNIGNHWVTIGFEYFSFFSIATSFIGVSFSLFGFLADGFQIEQTTRGRLILTLLTMAPPFIISQLYPQFMKTLAYGGVTVALLLILLPALMVWRGRKTHHSSFKTPGGIFSIGLAIMAAALIIYPVLF